MPVNSKVRVNMVPTLDFASFGFLVQTLGVTLLTLLDASIHKDLHEWKRRVVLVVQFTRKVPVSFVRRNERSDCDGRRRGEQ